MKPWKFYPNFMENYDFILTIENNKNKFNELLSFIKYVNDNFLQGKKRILDVVYIDNDIEYLEKLQKLNWELYRYFFRNLILSDDIINHINEYKDKVKLIMFYDINFINFDNLKSFIKKIKNNNIDLEIRFTQTNKIILDEIKNIIYYLKENNIKYITTDLIKNPEFVENDIIEFITKNNNDYTVEYNGKKYLWRELISSNLVYSYGQMCSAGNKSLYIDYTGNVYPCETLKLSNISLILNIYENNWKNFKLYKNFKCTTQYCNIELFLL